ncbi:MAG: Exodeoxyribonuclease large subunit, partial [Labilithrix sp.]|nr:Exodeoxyribonuclease large subunit [Labilithrix sp.]
MDGKRPRPGESLSFDWTLPAPSPKKAPEPVAPAPEPPPPSVAPTSVIPASAPLQSATERDPVWVPPPLPERPAAAPAAKPEPRVLTVGQLGRVVGRSLERTFTTELWVEGEVSGARPASSGHVYFCMKDENEEAAIDVVLYRSQVTPRGRALIKDGARVRVRGKPTYWSPRGKLQFVGDRVEPTGKGALLEALEKLKEKLQAEGLFAPEKKRPLPHDPRIIGVVTSAQGAVIHDVCKVAFRRGGARILLAPAQVQGAGAADSIRRALRMLQKVDAVDVIVVGRGGGSQEDLLAFNDEQLVRDVAACRVPVVSAVGHEVDVTLVDFAADARAATPSQAAEMIVPDATARRRLLEERTGRLRRAMQARIAEDRVVAGRLAQAFGDPRLLIASAQQRIDEHMLRLGRVLTARLAREKEGAAHLGSRLAAAHPRERIARDRARASELAVRLASVTRAEFRDRGDRAAVLDRRLAALAPLLVRDRADQVSSLAGRLDAMSPLKVLSRGYAIVTRTVDGHAVRAASEVSPGEALSVRVGDGAFEAEVTRVDPKEAAARSGRGELE